MISHTFRLKSRDFPLWSSISGCCFQSLFRYLELDQQTKKERNGTPCGIHPSSFGDYFSSHPTTILRRLLKAPRHTICFR
uniref:Uncharacterized protein n=2 Tax=Picea TaxID=3328 RepID=A0A101LX02_PICGL|nr:hypothetical protein ABT39_MTgene6344 [Picea glauca]QHR91414.1 hypothetical protein Q903MT_gene5448 [Picea sitchensis]